MIEQMCKAYPDFGVVKAYDAFLLIGMTPRTADARQTIDAAGRLIEWAEEIKAKAETQVGPGRPDCLTSQKVDRSVPDGPGLPASEPLDAIGQLQNMASRLSSVPETVKWQILQFEAERLGLVRYVR